MGWKLEKACRIQTAQVFVVIEGIGGGATQENSGYGWPLREHLTRLQKQLGMS